MRDRETDRARERQGNRQRKRAGGRDRQSERERLIINIYLQNINIYLQKDIYIQ
jgi:hypothetical protein